MGKYPLSEEEVGIQEERVAITISSVKQVDSESLTQGIVVVTNRVQSLIGVAFCTLFVSIAA